MKKVLFLAITCFAMYTGFAQEKKEKTSQGKADTIPAKMYTCPMHPDVQSAKPGRCPKCGMALLEKIVYVCPMHPEVVSAKPGKCPKCGMPLKIKNDAPKPKKDSSHTM